ncbi:rhomboid family intramembrane serine protease [Rubritalea sp.]|uniref:rhomboid family intramembrane serine protease n=1 Tax=Rubritalea sp. TaxID=2109375 RepID=UPI003F4AAA84
MNDSLRSGEVWRLLTFQFLHANLSHVLMNMVGLYFFGTIVERVLGMRRYLAYYLICGVAGGLFYYLLVYFGLVNPGYIVGASAGLYGVLAALVVIAPNMQVMLLIPPIPMKMRTLAWVLLGLALFSILVTGRNAGGEAGHLGGALIGFFLMKFPRALGWADRIGTKQTIVKKAAQSGPYQAKVRPRTKLNLDTTEVDRILDKVSAEGLHSLTDAERETLHRVSNKD